MILMRARKMFFWDDFLPRILTLKVNQSCFRDKNNFSPRSDGPSYLSRWRHFLVFRFMTLPISVGEKEEGYLILRPEALHHFVTTVPQHYISPSRGVFFPHRRPTIFSFPAQNGVLFLHNYISPCHAFKPVPLWKIWIKNSWPFWQRQH